MDGSIGRVSSGEQRPARVSKSPTSVVAPKSKEEQIQELYRQLRERIKELATKYLSHGMPAPLAWAHAKRVVLTPRAEWSDWGKRMLSARGNAVRWANVRAQRKRMAEQLEQTGLPRGFARPVAKLLDERGPRR